MLCQFLKLESMFSNKNELLRNAEKEPLLYRL